MFLSYFKNNKSSPALIVNIVIISVIVLFISINTLSNQLFSGARLDLTQNNLYTLNKGTFKIL